MEKTYLIYAKHESICETTAENEKDALNKFIRGQYSMLEQNLIEDLKVVETDKNSGSTH